MPSCRPQHWRATQLLLDIVGGVPGPIVEAVSREDLPAATQVTLRQSRLQSALGVEIDAEAVDEAMARLGFVVYAREETAAGVEWQVLPPSHRFDIALEADLIEEVCRISGTTIFQARTCGAPRPGRGAVGRAFRSTTKAATSAPWLQRSYYLFVY